MRSWDPPMHCEGPSFTHALLMDEGTQIQGQRPQPPCHLCILENFLKTPLEPELGIHPSSPAQMWHQDFLSSSNPAEICRWPCQRSRKPPAKSLEPGSEDMAAWTAPTLWANKEHQSMDGTPGPAQDRSHTRIHAGPEAAPREPELSQGQIEPGAGA